MRILLIRYRLLQAYTLHGFLLRSVHVLRHAYTYHPGRGSDYPLLS